MKKENIATARCTDLVVSTKKAVEVCNCIRRKSIAKARNFLNDVLQFKKAVPYRRYNMDLPHRKGKQGPGRYPINTVKAVLAVLNSAVSNAEDKGLRSEDLFVETVMANKGPTSWRYGRQMRRQAKRTHIEITVKEKKGVKRAPKKEESKLEAKAEKEAPKVEKEAPKTEKEAPKQEAKEEKKPEEKKEVKAEEKKTEEKKEASKKPTEKEKKQ